MYYILIWIYILFPIYFLYMKNTTLWSIFSVIIILFILFTWYFYIAINDIKTGVIIQEEQIKKLEKNIEDYQSELASMNMSFVEDFSMNTSWDYKEKSWNPSIEINLENSSGKIITQAMFNISIKTEDWKTLLSEKVTQSFNPWFLPWWTEKINKQLGFKWTQEALEATLWIDELISDNIVVETSNIQDIEGQKYSFYTMKESYKKEVKEKYAEIQEISKEIRSHRDKINFGNLLTNEEDELNKKIALLSQQSQKIDPHGVTSMEYYDLIESETVEWLIVKQHKLITTENK